MIKALVLLLILFSSLKAFSASHVLPKDFLHPIVEVSLTPEGPFELLKVKSTYTSGRSEENPILVYFPKETFYQDLPYFIRFHLTMVNKSGHIMRLNASVKEAGDYIGLEFFKGLPFVGGHASKMTSPIIEKSEICFLVDCYEELNNGLVINFFLDEKSRVGSSRALPLFDRKSLVYQFLFE